MEVYNIHQKALGTTGGQSFSIPGLLRFGWGTHKIKIAVKATEDTKHSDKLESLCAKKQTENT